MNLASGLALLLLPLGAALTAAPASAISGASVTSTYYFTGTCTDCSGIVHGELSLSNYVLGSPITSSNFVSFHYDGSDLVPGGFTITDTPYGVGGSINAPLPAAESFYAYGTTNTFRSDTDGSWNLGPTGNYVADYGTAGTYSATAPTTAVPEPISLSLLAAGLAGTALVRRRRA